MKFKSLRFTPIALNSRRVVFLAIEGVGTLNEGDYKLVNKMATINRSIRELAGESVSDDDVFEWLNSVDYAFYFDDK